VESNAPGPWATMEPERGPVEIWATGRDLHGIHAPNGIHRARGMTRRPASHNGKRSNSRPRFIGAR
jgi:hypothetical protein